MCMDYHFREKSGKTLEKSAIIWYDIGADDGKEVFPK